MDIKKTTLNNLHKKLGAKMVPFGGFEMPVSYRGIIEEHQAVRSAMGLFDVSHMGLLKFVGPGAEKFLDSMLTKPVSKVQVGKGSYALLCNEQGGAIDDLIFYKVNENEIILALNASNKEKDKQWLLSHISAEVKIESFFDSHSLFALQGPKVPEFLAFHDISLDYKTLYSTQKARLGGVEALFMVSGYTGELGCEISLKNEDAETLFTFLLDQGKPLGLLPVGLGARDTLRTEMGFSLYGHELSEEINPVEASLNWAIDWESDFIGKEALALAKENPQRKLIALKNTSSRQAPRAGMRLLDSEGKEIGFISSGTFAPSLGYAIGMGIVNLPLSSSVWIDMRGKPVEFELTKRPFISRVKQ